MDTFKAYRKMFGSTADGQVCWWYCGTIFVHISGYPPIPVVQAETAMVYRFETISDAQFRVHWRELGYFRDPLTGEVAENWLNPVTGETVPYPRNFEEGPGLTTIHALPGGVRMELRQPFAVVQSIEAAAAEIDGRVRLVQTERKVRGYPQADGTLPEPGSPGTSEALTVLTITGSPAEIADKATDNAASSGVYEFEVSAIPPWMGFGDRAGATKIIGVMHKSAMDNPLNPGAWAQLQKIFPHYFKDGRLADGWI